MTAEGLLHDLPSSIEVHAHQIDLLRDRVLFVRVSRRDFARAMFLDGRVAGPEQEHAWLDWDQIAQIARRLPPPARPHFIFHIGHCGSTLLTRLLEELGVLALREPLPLRTLAELRAELDSMYSRWSRPIFDARLALMLALYGRGAGPRAVKATSFCNDLAPAVLAQDGSPTITVCFIRLMPFITNMLMGPNSTLDMLALAPMRLRRLQARLGSAVGELSKMSPGVIAAMSWLTEMSALAVTTESKSGADPRVHCIDFDEFLGDVGGSLRSLALHVLPGVAPDAVKAAAASQVLREYSKAPDQPFSPELRRTLLSDGLRQWSDEIGAGLAWCDRAAERFPAVASLVGRYRGT